MGGWLAGARALACVRVREREMEERLSARQSSVTLLLEDNRLLVICFT